MLSPFERIVALRYLRARREEGFISVIAVFSFIGIALGVATLIVVLAVMNGVRGEMIKSVIGLEGHITVYSNEHGIDDYDALSKAIAEIDGVSSAIPKIEGQIMASARGISTGAMVTAYRHADLKTKPLLVNRIIAGSDEGLEDGSSIVMGQRMAEKLRLGIHDDLTLISPQGRATIAGLVPRVKAYSIGGMFSIGMFAYDNSLIVMPFEAAQKYFKLRDNDADLASSLEVRIDDADEALAIGRTISQMLGNRYRVYDWKSSNNHIFQAVMVQRNVMFLILTLIILVASFNIVSSLIMLVREKSHDIAVLRTMGATRNSIMKIFIVCGAAVGVMGTIIGVVFGLLIAFNTENIQLWLESMMGHKLFADELYFLSHLPSKVESMEVLSVVALSLLLSLLATIYPARRAATLDPAEVLRYE